jgi:hypothetical protein
MWCSRAFLFAAFSISVLAGCAKPERMTLPRCTILVSGRSLTLDVRAVNKTDKPIASADIVADFYQGFRFQRAGGTATFTPALRPGDGRDISFPAHGPKRINGTAMRCAAARVTFSDGSTDESTGPVAE